MLDMKRLEAPGNARLHLLVRFVHGRRLLRWPSSAVASSRRPKRGIDYEFEIGTYLHWPVRIEKQMSKLRKNTHQEPDPACCPALVKTWSLNKSLTASDKECIRKNVTSKFKRITVLEICTNLAGNKREWGREGGKEWNSFTFVLCRWSRRDSSGLICREKEYRKKVEAALKQRWSRTCCVTISLTPLTHFGHSLVLWEKTNEGVHAARVLLQWDRAHLSPTPVHPTANITWNSRRYLIFLSFLVEVLWFFAYFPVV